MEKRGSMVEIVENHMETLVDPDSTGMVSDFSYCSSILSFKFYCLCATNERIVRRIFNISNIENSKTIFESDKASNGR